MLTLAGVPIGQAEDAPARLAEALASADVIAAEDTRRVRQLATALDVRLTGRVVSYYDVIEVRRAAELVTELRRAGTCSWSPTRGCPRISDPGYRLVAAAAAAGIRVTAVPGPSAVTTALAVSGLPTDRFCFEGFPPRKRGRAGAAVRASWRPTRAPTCSSSRRAGSRPPWRSCGDSHGDDRAAVVCRELTKTHEEIVRGTLAELAAWATPDPGAPQVASAVRSRWSWPASARRPSRAGAPAPSAREARRPSPNAIAAARQANGTAV